MDRKQENGERVNPKGPPPSAEPRKKVYKKPELVKWGSVESLTSGSTGKGFDGGFAPQS